VAAVGVWRLAFGVWRAAGGVRRLAFGDNDGRPPFANHTKATELNGRARLITLVQRISFSSRLTFGGIRRRRLRESNAPGIKTMSDRLLAATVLRLALGGDCPATGLIFTKPPSSSEAARVALPQTAVAIVWLRLAFGVRRTSTTTGDRDSRTGPWRLRSMVGLA
jgi:hypothetical protein